MHRQRFALTALSACALFAPVALAQPAGLLGQAIEENNAAPADPAKVKAIVREADGLVAQKKYEDAIRLYSKAYRMSPSDQATYARLLSAKKAAGKLSAEDREAWDLIQRQQATTVQQTLEWVRLDLVQAKSALREGDATLAKAKGESAQARLDSLPTDVDVVIYRKQVRDVLNSAKVRALKDSRSNKATNDGVLTLGDQGTTAAVTTATGSTATTTTTTTATTTTTTDANTQATAVTTGEIVDTTAIALNDKDQHVYDKSIAAALRQNRVDWLLQSNEAAIAPTTDLQYPSDWVERTRKRVKHKDGVIYEGQPFTGADGQTYITAIYDLGDLVAPVPDFYSPYSGYAYLNYQQSLDRQYLRDRSMIFNGYAEDLAAGLPLLHYFGGVGPSAMTQRTDPNEVARVVATLEAFLNHQTGGAGPQNVPQGLQPQ